MNSSFVEIRFAFYYFVVKPSCANIGVHTFILDGRISIHFDSSLVFIAHDGPIRNRIDRVAIYNFKRGAAV